MVAGGEPKAAGGLALASVQFFFTLGWTVYAIYLPGLLAAAHLPGAWLPLLLMADQLIFSVMDLVFALVADRLADGYRKLARLLLWFTIISTFAFVLLPMSGNVSPSLLIAVLFIWVLSASVLRAPTMVLLAKRARAAQQGRLVRWYAAGTALAAALSPYLGTLLKGADPRLPFALAAVTLLIAVVVLLRTLVAAAPESRADEPQPVAFAAYAPVLPVLVLAAGGFQLHAFVNAGPQYLAYAAKENLPWLTPLLWVGFFAALPAVGALVKRLGMLTVATAGILLAALGCYASAVADSLPSLVAMQVLSGVGWAAALAGLMEYASTSGTRGAEGLFMGSFFAVLALATFGRILLVSQLLPHSLQLQGLMTFLPSGLLLAAGLIAALHAFRVSGRRTEGAQLRSPEKV